jgi:hypothetical protein
MWIFFGGGAKRTKQAPTLARSKKIVRALANQQYYVYWRINNKNARAFREGSGRKERSVVSGGRPKHAIPSLAVVLT